MPSPTQSTEVPAEAVEILARRRFERLNPFREWEKISDEEAASHRNLARRELSEAAPSIRNQEHQRLARKGGELPEAFGELDPESDVGVLIRAALTVAEEDAAQSEHQRLKEALGPNIHRVTEALETWLLDYADPDDGDWPERAEYVQAINDFRATLDTLDPSKERK